MFFRDDVEEETGTTTEDQFQKAVPSEDLTGSRGRFYSRLDRWKKARVLLPRTSHHVQWLIHNCIVHPMIAVAPVTCLLELHELSSKWLNTPFSVGKSFVLTSPALPKAKSWVFWVIHNSLGHILIGLFPIRPFFFFHDWSAKQMGTPNWF